MSTPRATTQTAAAAEAGARRTPQSRAYDLVVIGGGSAGISAAGLARALGARVALVDRERLGGECLYTGCVPSKALLRVARLAHDIRQAHTFGLSTRLDPVDLGAVADRVRWAIEEVAPHDSPEVFERIGIDVLFGAACFVSPRELALNGHTIQAKAYLLATGSHAAVPTLPGLDSVGYLTNDTIFDLRRLPARLTVVGGGPVGVEMAQAFARLGARVTLVQRSDRLLPREEPEASAALRERLEAEHITLLTRTTVTGFAVRDEQKIVQARAADDTALELASDEILLAVGRAPNVAGLGLEAAGVAFDPARGVQADTYLRTTNPRVYAAGDVKGAPFFTHAAAQQARLAVRNAITPSRKRLDERVMPWATFTDPEVAHVGLTEDEARRHYGDGVRAYVTRFADVDRAAAEGATAGFVKLVARGKGELLGAHIVGLSAGEYINELALALAARISLGTIADTVHVYPTLALAIQQAAGAYSLARLRAGASSRVVRGYLHLRK